MRVIGFILLFLVLGFAVGYMLYGKVNDDYVNPLVFFSKPENLLGRAYSGLHGFEKKRKNLITATVAGGIIGLFFGAISSATKRSPN